MGTKYTTNAASGYNSSPPSDDGSQTAANLITWAKHKEKIGDPLKTLAEAINTDLVAAFDYAVRQITTSDSLVAGDHMRTVEVAPSVSTVVTVTLADAATMTNIYRVYIKNSGSKQCTIARTTGADTIDGVAANISIPAGSAFLLTTNNAANGYLIAGAYPLEITNLTEETAPAVSDTVVIYDASASALRKIRLQNLLGFTKLNSGTVTDGATLDIVLTSYAAYPNKMVVLNLIPATDGVEFYLRLSTDAGSNFAEGATDYGYEVTVANATTSENNTAIRLTADGLVGNAATEGISLTLKLYDTTSTAKWQRVSWDGTYIDSAATPVVRAPHGGGARRTAQDTDAIRFLFSSGNIASGSWTLYGFN